MPDIHCVAGRTRLIPTAEALQPGAVPVVKPPGNLAASPARRMFELHMLRACTAIRDGYVTIDQALAGESVAAA